MSTKKVRPDSRKHHVPRCTFVTPSDRRCKMTVMPGRSRSGERNVFCAFHAKQEIQVYDAAVVSQEILGPLDDFRSACAINRALGKLFTVTAEDRIPIRNAAVLAYIAQLMLRTLKPLRHEIIESGGQHGMDAILRDVFALLDNTFDKDQPAQPGKVTPHWREKIEGGLAVLRRAGYALPTARTIPEQNSATSPDAVNGNENRDDDHDERDDDSVDQDETEGENETQAENGDNCEVQENPEILFEDPVAKRDYEAKLRWSRRGKKMSN